MREAVCALVLSGDGLILAVSRKDNRNAFGLPGGKVDPGETPEQAIIREVREETGLEIANLEAIFTSICEGGKDGVEYLAITYTGSVIGDISTSEEGVVRWVTKDVLLSGPFGRYNAALFEKLWGSHV